MGIPPRITGSRGMNSQGIRIKLGNSWICSVSASNILRVLSCVDFLTLLNTVELWGQHLHVTILIKKLQGWLKFSFKIHHYSEFPKTFIIRMSTVNWQTVLPRLGPREEEAEG